MDEEVGPAGRQLDGEGRDYLEQIISATNRTNQLIEALLKFAGESPSELNVGAAYSFAPTASDANGDTLTFGIQNKPVWATFATASGVMKGTPAAGDAGTYANVIISVSDGKASASLAAFTLTVNQISNGTATLNWMPPTQNTDGTVLMDLAGYRVHYGTTAGNLTQSVTVSNTGLASYTISNLSSGTWYFSISAYTKTGIESDLSDTVSTTFTARHDQNRSLVHPRSHWRHR
ncbi:MAG: hypothetical protein JWM63_1461 [Gammaproteobacteria bacterium]|nr:hypothetical protein [Gammaproteobacteria bacterium]